MLSTLGFLALVIGIVLVVLGYTIEARALRPGWGLVILGAVLVLISYVTPVVHTAALGVLQ